MKKTFKNDKKYLHLPIHDGPPDNYRYIKVYDGEELKDEFYIGIASKAEERDFYTAMYLGRYSFDKITLECEEEDAPDYLDLIIQGDEPKNEKLLYPDLYKEPKRQQIHFSACCGWLNDPNGLFWQNGKFNMYFQHNPYSAHHFGVNISWGHAISEDGVHFTELHDAIMPCNNITNVASGSAYVDENNIFSMGKGTIIASYTALQARNYRGREKNTQCGGQMLLYSTDGGITFEYFEKNPIITVPDGERWRDPKIFEYQGKLVAIVYETYNGEDCASFYVSKNCKDWKLVSRSKDIYECPDLFPLEIEETGETLWGLYGANGKYSIGNFKDFEFETIESNHYIDYGENVYAGQTFNNYPSSKIRYHIAWMRDNGQRCALFPDTVYDGAGFNQAMSLMCELSIHKTKNGYRIFRKPLENYKELRKEYSEVMLSAKQILKVPAEYLFTVSGEEDVAFFMNGYGFSYNAKERKIASTSGKEYVLCSDGIVNIRLFTDRRSMEFFINDEISLSYFVQPEIQLFEISGIDELKAERYLLSSIWENE